jgi:hypothetical protein
MCGLCKGAIPKRKIATSFYHLFFLEETYSELAASLYQQKSSNLFFFWGVEACSEIAESFYPFFKKKNNPQQSST